MPFHLSCKSRTSRLTCYITTVHYSHLGPGGGGRVEGEKGREREGGEGGKEKCVNLVVNLKYTTSLLPSLKTNCDDEVSSH